jgi:heptosyltransferase-1
MNNRHNSDHPRILLVKLSSFGDVLHALPTLEALRRAFPQGQITWLVEAAYAPLLAGHPALNEVWVAPRLKPGQLLTGANPANLRELLARLRSRAFDLVVDLQGLLKSAIWVRLARSPRKVGYDQTRELSYLALTERVPPFDPDGHAVWRYLNLARYLGAPDAAPPARPRFRLGLNLPTDLRRLVPDAGRHPLVVLHPGARWQSKLWPAANWAGLASRLRARGFQVAVTGGPGDRELAAPIFALLAEPPVDLVGRTSLAELAGVLRAARLMVTTDTGAMHLAAALGTPVAALFGPTAPWRTGPFGTGHEILRLNLPCSPCFKRRCPEPRCLTDLPVETVAAAAEKILSRTPN